MDLGSLKPAEGYKKERIKYNGILFPADKKNPGSRNQRSR